jgi:hypothetical protein
MIGNGLDQAVTPRPPGEAGTKEETAMGKDGTVRQSGKLGSLSADDPARGGEGRPRAPYHAPTLNALLIENSAAAAGGTANDGAGKGAGNAGGAS